MECSDVFQTLPFPPPPTKAHGDFPHYLLWEPAQAPGGKAHILWAPPTVGFPWSSSLSGLSAWRPQLPVGPSPGFLPSTGSCSSCVCECPLWEAAFPVFAHQFPDSGGSNLPCILHSLVHLRKFVGFSIVAPCRMEW